MRFLIGLALGFGAGLIGAIMLAPDRAKAADTGWPPDGERAEGSMGQNHGSAGGLRGALQSLQDQINAALSEAKEASEEAEEEMRARYEKMAKRGSGNKT